MTVSKRLRFEILRRDNHACRYCGACAPDAVLTIDHVHPKALGGGDEASNLVTACKDCNAGKSSGTVDAALVADVEQDAERWARAIELAAASDRNHRDAMADAKRQFRAAWNQHLGDHWLDIYPTWGQTIETWLNTGLIVDDLIAWLPLAMVDHIKFDRTWRYFCGIVWKRIGEYQDRARLIVESWDDDY